MKIRFTTFAQQQFQEALRYIQADNSEAANRLRQRAETGLRRLLDFPESGRHIPEFPDLPYREVVIAPHRFFYRVEREVIWVVAVWHEV